MVVNSSAECTFTPPSITISTISTTTESDASTVGGDGTSTSTVGGSVGTTSNNVSSGLKLEENVVTLALLLLLGLLWQ